MTTSEWKANQGGFPLLQTIWMSQFREGEVGGHGQAAFLAEVGCLVENFFELLKETQRQTVFTSVELVEREVIATQDV